MPDLNRARDSLAAFAQLVGRNRAERVSPHSLRSALRDDIVYIAEQGGWTDPTFVIRVYSKAVKRRGRLSGAYPEAFDTAIHWAEMGRIAEDRPADGSRSGSIETPRSRLSSGYGAS